MRSPRRVSMESSVFQTVPLDSTSTPHGVHRDYWELVGNAVWSPHGVHVDSLWTPQSLHGLHGNPWVSVKYSFFSFIVPAEVHDGWDNKIIQILQNTPSLYSLC